MRIAMFSDSYHPYVSGVVRSIELLTRELRALGHTPVIFAPSYPGFPDEEGVFRYPSVPAPTYDTFRLAVPFSVRVSREVRSIQPQIIHVHSPFLLGLAGAHWARLLKVPLVLTYHTLYKQYVHYFPFLPQAVRAVTSSYLNWFCNRCDCIVAPSEGVRRMLEADGLTRPVAVIPTGVEVADRLPVDPAWFRQRIGLGPEPRALLFVGRLGREKNLPFLLRSLKRLNVSSDVPYHLVIVGGGPEEESLKSFVKGLGVENDVTFAGRWPHQDVLRAYAGADVFVFASQTETQGLVVLEAMNSGLPVVAVRGTGVEDVVEDGVSGFLTSPGIEEFCDRVRRVTEDADTHSRLSEAAFRRAREYSTGRQAAVMAGLYEDLLRRPRL